MPENLGLCIGDGVGETEQVDYLARIICALRSLALRASNRHKLEVSSCGPKPIRNGVPIHFTATRI